MIGGALAMSSTAIVIRQLGEQAELNRTHSRIAIGILLFQDLAFVPLLAWTATVAETILGAALLGGVYTRAAGFASGVLLSLFAIGMTIGTGVKPALDASVFSAAAGAFGLALLGPDPWSVDRLRAKPSGSDGAA